MADRVMCTQEEFWLSGPYRDGADVRYSNVGPVVDDVARTAYEAFLRAPHCRVASAAEPDLVRCRRSRLRV